MQLQNAVVEEPETEGNVPTLHRHDCTEIDRDAEPVARDWRGSVCEPGAWPCPDCLGDDLVAVPKSGTGRCFHSRPCSTVVGRMESYRFRRREPPRRRLRPVPADEHQQPGRAGDSERDGWDSDQPERCHARR